MLTPTLTGVSCCNSLGTAASAFSSSSSSESAAALGSFANELKPGFFYNIKSRQRHEKHRG